MLSVVRKIPKNWAFEFEHLRSNPPIVVIVIAILRLHSVAIVSIIVSTERASIIVRRRVIRGVVEVRTTARRILPASVVSSVVSENNDAYAKYSLPGR